MGGICSTTEEPKTPSNIDIDRSSSYSEQSMGEIKFSLHSQ